MQEVDEVADWRAVAEKDGIAELHGRRQRSEPVAMVLIDPGGGMAIGKVHALSGKRQELTLVIAADRGPAARHQIIGRLARPQRSGQNVAEIDEGGAAKRL